MNVGYFTSTSMHKACIIVYYIHHSCCFVPPPQVVMGQLEQRISDYSHQRQLNEHRKQLVDVQVSEQHQQTVA